MTIGDNRVAVPEYFFKIIASPYSSTPRGIAFIMPNEDCDDPLYHYAVTIDSVESRTGIDFLYNLPDSLENFIEQNYDLKAWQL
jgi:endonuclease G